MIIDTRTPEISGLRAESHIVATLVDRGDLWEVAPGVVGLKGYARALFDLIAHLVQDAQRAAEPEEWKLPEAVPFQVLDRADYFQSFPGWLTAASHLSDQPESLERVACSPNPPAEVPTALHPCSVALPPALCYQTYSALAGRVLDSPCTMTAQGTCWRHERERLTPLSRGWAFTMREVVRMGDRPTVDALAERGMERAVRLADSLGLTCSVEVASDPFYAPTAAGKARLQRVKGLKHELVALSETGNGLALASSNLHDRFFGEAFDIRLPDGSAAFSACVAFGLERWTLAFLMTHGTEPRGWAHVLSPKHLSRVLSGNGRNP